MSVIDDYLKDYSQPEREALERVRTIVKEAAPEAEEVITYGMPGFKYKKKYLIAFAPFKDHLSIFPGANPTEMMKGKLDGFTLSKGTIQFTLDKPIPKEIIKQLLQIRIKDIETTKA